MSLSNEYILVIYLLTNVEIQLRGRIKVKDESTGAVKVPFFDFGEIVDTKLRSQAENENFIILSQFENNHLII